MSQPLLWDLEPYQFTETDRIEALKANLGKPANDFGIARDIPQADQLGPVNPGVRRGSEIVAASPPETKVGDKGR